MIICQQPFYHFDNIFREIYSLYSFIFYILSSFIFLYSFIFYILLFWVEIKSSWISCLFAVSSVYLLVPSAYLPRPQLIYCSFSSFACIPDYSLVSRSHSLVSRSHSLVSRLIRCALGLYDNSAEGVTRLP